MSVEIKVLSVRSGEKTREMKEMYMLSIKRYGMIVFTK